jgi:hypothetical protein
MQHRFDENPTEPEQRILHNFLHGYKSKEESASRVLPAFKACSSHSNSIYVLFLEIHAWPMRTARIKIRRVSPNRDFFTQ